MLHDDTFTHVPTPGLSASDHRHGHEVIMHLYRLYWRLHELGKHSKAPAILRAACERNYDRHDLALASKVRYLPVTAQHTADELADALVESCCNSHAGLGAQALLELTHPPVAHEPQDGKRVKVRRRG